MAAGLDVRVGIVGVGAAARRHHLPVLTGMRGVRVTALCDPSEEQAALATKRFGLKAQWFLVLERMLEEGEVDVAHICSPGHLHFRQALAAVAAGKHVLVEKPPAHSVAEAVALAEAARSAGVKVGCVFNTRYKPLVQELRALIERGLLGEIVKVHAVHHGGMVFADAPWLWDETQSKYLLYENGIHLVDLLVYLLGPHARVMHAEPFAQRAVNVTTEIQALIRFESGATAFLDVTQDTTRHSTFLTEIRVFGTAQDALLRHFPPLLSLSAGLVGPHQALLAEVRSFAHFSWLLASRRMAAYRNASHAAVIKRFYDWVVRGEHFPETVSEVIPTLRLLEDLAKCIPSYTVSELDGERASRLS